MRASQRQSPSFRLWRYQQNARLGRGSRTVGEGGEAVKAQPVSYRYLLTYRGAPFVLVAATDATFVATLKLTFPARRDGPDACL